MILIAIALIGCLLLFESFANSTDYGFVTDENSIWHDEYEEEIKKLHKQAKDGKITLTSKEIRLITTNINKKAKMVNRYLRIVFIFLCIFTILWLEFGSYEKNEITKYSLLPIQDESILYGQSKTKTYYIAEIVNKNNSYMFFYKNEDSPEEMEIVANNIVKYDNVDCEPCVVKETKKYMLKCNLLQKILFFNFDNNTILEENYKFYLPKENYIKIFSY